MLLGAFGAVAWVYPELPGGAWRARNEFASLQERLAKVNTISGTLYLTGSPAFSGTAHFKLQRPNLFILDSPWRFSASDGKTVTQAERTLKVFRKAKAQPSGMPVSADLIGFESFATAEHTGIEPPFLAEPIGVRNERFDGVMCRDLEFRFRTRNVTLHVYVDKSSGLPKGFRVISPDVKMYPEAVGRYQDLLLGQPLDKKDFAYQVPKGLMERKDATSTALKEGSDAPAFKLRTADGKLVTSSSKLTLLDFWFYGCEPCRKEHTYLKDLQRQYGDKLSIVSVNIMDGPDVVRRYEQAEHFDYPLVLNGDGKNDLVSAYRVMLYPTNYLIRDGKVLARIDGFAREKITAAVKAASRD